MAASFQLVYDDIAPGGVALALNGNAAYATARAITAALSTTDNPATGYSILIWGDVDPSVNSSIQATEAASSWITPGAFPANQAVTLSTGDGSKTIYAKIRDDVGNPSGAVSKSITLDTTAPVPNITTAPDKTKVGPVAGFRTTTFAWQADSIFDAYEVAVVSSAASARGTGTVIGTGNGSSNVAGSAGGYPATTNINTTLDSRDVAAASPGSGIKVIKVFVRDVAGNWSV